MIILSLSSYISYRVQGIAALRGMDTRLPIDILYGLMAQAQEPDAVDELWAYSENKSKMFDTVCCVHEV